MASADLSKESLEQFKKLLLEEKQLLQKKLITKIKSNQTHKDIVDKYVRYHYHRLYEMAQEQELYPEAIRGALVNALRDLMLYFELNHAEKITASSMENSLKGYVPYSVETLALLARVLWEEDWVRMKFKTQLTQFFCDNVVTLKAGTDENISKRHFNDAMYNVKDSTLVTVERMVNRLKKKMVSLRNDFNKNKGLVNYEPNI